jgi:hypothetical protein
MGTDFAQIDCRYNKLIEERKEKSQNGLIPILFETNLIDLIIKSELGEDPFIKEFVSFYDNLV